MHPVARALIKYWKNLRTQQSIFSVRFYRALLTLHVSAPFGGHLQVVQVVTALDIFVFVNHLKMTAKWGRNM
jgi:hypothetical protein